MANEQRRSPRAPSVSPLLWPDKKEVPDQEEQRSTTKTSSPLTDPDDSSYQPPPRLKNQTDEVSTPRSLRKRKVVEDEDDGWSSKASEQKVESRKRRHSSPQAQTQAKKLKTPGAQSEGGDSDVIFVASSNGDAVMETTETEDSSEDHRKKEQVEDLRTPSVEKTQQDECKSNTEETISRAEHERLFQEKRDQFNTILKQYKKDNKELQEECNKNEAEAVKYRGKYERMLEQEDEWYDNSMARYRSWKRGEIKSKTDDIQAKYDHELEKVKKSMDKKFQTQEKRMTSLKEEWKGKVESSKKEASDAKKQYEALEKTLRKETDEKIKKFKPENTKEMRAKAEEIQQLRAENEKLNNQLASQKNEYNDLRGYAKQQKTDRNGYKEELRKEQDLNKQLTDKVSVAESKKLKAYQQVNALDQHYKAQMHKYQQQLAVQTRNSEESQQSRVQLQRTQFAMNNANQKSIETIETLNQEKSRLQIDLKTMKAESQNKIKSVENRNQVLKVVLAFFLATWRKASSSKNQVSSSAPAIISSTPQQQVLDTQASPSVGHDQQPGNAPRPNPTDQGVHDKGVNDTASQEQSISTEPAKDCKLVESIQESEMADTPSQQQAKEVIDLSVEDGKEDATAVADADGVPSGGDAMEGVLLDGIGQSAKGVARSDSAAVGEEDKAGASMVADGAGGQAGTMASTQQEFGRDKAADEVSATTGAQQPGTSWWPSKNLPCFPAGSSEEK